MGIKVNYLNAESFDILRDLERARVNLKEKSDNCTNIPLTEEAACLPSVEMKFLDWKSDNSDDDGFHLVSSRKKRRNNKQKVKNQVLKSREGLHSVSEAFTPEGGISKTRSGYNLRKWRNNKKRSYYDMSLLEL